MAASRISLPRNWRFARSHASHSPTTSATAVEIVATRRLSQSGNQSMPMGTSMVSQGSSGCSLSSQQSSPSSYFLLLCSYYGYSGQQRIEKPSRPLSSDGSRGEDSPNHRPRQTDRIYLTAC